MPRVGSLPTVEYIPDYVSVDQERELLRRVAAEPKAKWTQVSVRRLQNHGGIVHTKGLIAAPFPKWLNPLVHQLHSEYGCLFADGAPNHVLINAYQPGEGIMSHEDGPSYISGVAILSLQHPAVIRFRRKQEDGLISPDPECSLLLMPRSLLTFSDEAYTHCLHGIDAVEEEVLDASLCNLHLIPDLGKHLIHGIDIYLEPDMDKQIEAASSLGTMSTVSLALPNEGGSVAAVEGSSVAVAEGGSVAAVEGSFEDTETASQGKRGVAGPTSTHAQTPLLVAREGERISLTVRRVQKVVKVLIGRK
eukprot:gene14730-20774_t